MAENLAEVVAMRAAWNASLSDDEKAKAQEERAAWGNEETKAERMAELQASFQAADVNEDGVLSQAEFVDFMGKLAGNLKARGVPSQGPDAINDDMKAKVWALYNAKTADVDGVSLPDFLGVVKDIQTAMQAAQ